MVKNVFGLVFAQFFFNYLISQNLGDTSINTNTTYANLINANPLKKRICRLITSAILKVKKRQYEHRKFLFWIERTTINCPFFFLQYTPANVNLC